MTMPPYRRFAAALGSLCCALPACGPHRPGEGHRVRERQEFGKKVRDYLMQNPEVLRDVLQELERKERARKAGRRRHRREGRAIFPRRWRSGDRQPQGDVTIVEFMDYNCGYCKRAARCDEARRAGQEPARGDQGVPDPRGLRSCRLARALAAEKQGKYKEMHVALMGHKGALNDEAIFELAKAAGLDVDKLKADMEDKAIAARIEQNHQLAQCWGSTARRPSSSTSS